jgi:hypothetical protein
MAVTINGTTGVAVPLGSASAPAETNTTSSTTGIYYPTSTTLGLSTNGTNAMYIDASQNVGIGTTSPGAKFGVSDGAVTLITSPYAAGTTGYFGTSTNHPLAILTNNTERMRIDSSGNLLVGATSQLISGTKLNVSGSTGVSVGVVSLNNLSFPSRKWSTGPDANGSFIVFNDASAGMYMAYGNTAWTSSSDERLKTDLIPIENAASKVSLLRAVTGRFKTDEEGKSRSFLIAQDVQAVLPEAVDATNPDKLGVQYTEVIPLLVAAIKELSAEVEALKSKVGA